MGDSDLQAIRRPGIGIRGAAFGAIHKVLQVDAKATPVATLSGTLNPGIPAAHNRTGSSGRDRLDLCPCDPALLRRRRSLLLS
jgi:hypothetical protein